MVTVSQVVQAALQELSLVPGLAAQTYAVPRLTHFVEDAFFTVFDDEHHWNDYLQRRTVAVANGDLAEDLVGTRNVKIENYADVLYVWPETSNKPLQELDMRTNHATITGSGARFIAPSTSVPHRPFIVLPSAFTGNVSVLLYTRPPRPFSSTTELYLDQMMLALGACFMYLASTGTNPGHAASMQTRFVDRVNKMKARENSGEIALDSRQRYNDTTEWREMP